VGTDLYEAMVEAKAIWEEGGNDALKEHLEKIEREIIRIPAPDRIGPNPETRRRS
jgi:hypothetical protein